MHTPPMVVCLMGEVPTLQKVPAHPPMNCAPDIEVHTPHKLSYAPKTEVCASPPMNSAPDIEVRALRKLSCAPETEARALHELSYACAQ